MNSHTIEYGHNARVFLPATAISPVALGIILLRLTATVAECTHASRCITVFTLIQLRSNVILVPTQPFDKGFSLMAHIGLPITHFIYRLLYKLVSRYTFVAAAQCQV
jgi:hypothetical protein